MSFHGRMGPHILVFRCMLSITYPYIVTNSNINVKPHYIASIVYKESESHIIRVSQCNHLSS